MIKGEAEMVHKCNKCGCVMVTKNSKSYICPKCGYNSILDSKAEINTKKPLQIKTCKCPHCNGEIKITVNSINKVE